jgi:hypothetical protein
VHTNREFGIGRAEETALHTHDTRNPEIITTIGLWRTHGEDPEAIGVSDFRKAGEKPSMKTRDCQNLKITLAVISRVTSVRISRIHQRFGHWETRGEDFPKIAKGEFAKKSGPSLRWMRGERSGFGESPEIFWIIRSHRVVRNIARGSFGVEISKGIRAIDPFGSGP